MRAKKTDTRTRREQITKAALDLIAVQGLNALSIGEIASSVGIVPSAVYRHFQSKESVLDSVLEFLHERLLQNVSIVRNESVQALERLRLLMMRHVRLLDENRAIPPVIFSDGIYNGDPNRKSAVRKIMSQYLGKVEEIVQEGQREGTIRDDLEPQTISLMFLGMILPAVVFRNASDGNFDVIEHAEKAWPAFARGISRSG